MMPNKNYLQFVLSVSTLLGLNISTVSSFHPFNINMNYKAKLNHIQNICMKPSAKFK